MGVLKHDVTMVTDMIDKYKGRTLPESNLPRNISSDGNVKNGTLSSLNLQHIARTPPPVLLMLYILTRGQLHGSSLSWIFMPLLIDFFILLWRKSLQSFKKFLCIHLETNACFHTMILLFYTSLKIKKTVLFLDGELRIK